jgi:hypothetical protein
MAEVQDEIWVLLGKYLCGEATSSESRLIELLLKENLDLMDFYQQLEAVYLNERAGNETAAKAFARLDQRIKNSPH